MLIDMLQFCIGWLLFSYIYEHAASFSFGDW